MSKREIDELVVNVQESVGYALVERLRQFMDENDKNFTGDARESFYYNKYDQTVKSGVPYAHIIDQGLPPNSEIDWGELRKWVKDSGKVDHDGTDADVDDLTWRVYHKIKKKGIEPTYMVVKTLLAMERGDSHAAI